MCSTDIHVSVSGDLIEIACNERKNVKHAHVAQKADKITHKPLYADLCMGVSFETIVSFFGNQPIRNYNQGTRLRAGAGPAKNEKGHCELRCTSRTNGGFLQSLQCTEQNKRRRRWVTERRSVCPLIVFYIGKGDGILYIHNHTHRRTNHACNAHGDQQSIAYIARACRWFPLHTLRVYAAGLHRAAKEYLKAELHTCKLKRSNRRKRKPTPEKTSAGSLDRERLRSGRNGQGRLRFGSNGQGSKTQGIRRKNTELLTVTN